MLNRSTFFTAIRPMFAGSLSQGQVNCINALLDACELHRVTDARHIAYILGTAKWETAQTMQPIAEIGRGRGRKYGEPDPVTKLVYYGRGFVQLTWKANYAKAGAELGLPLVENPDLALQASPAAEIIVVGMSEGWFTGKKLVDYLNPKVTDWAGARRSVNGMDRAAEIAELAKQFHAAILLATTADPAEQTTRPSVPPPEPPAAPMHTSVTGWAQVGTGAAGALVATGGAINAVNGVAKQATDVANAAKETGGTLAGLWSTVADPKVLAVLGFGIIVAAGVTWYRRLQLKTQQGV